MESGITVGDTRARLEGLSATSRMAARILNRVRLLEAATPPGSSAARGVQRAEELGLGLCEDLIRLGDRVDRGYLESSEFQSFVFRSLRGALENYQQEKAEALRAILVNSALCKDLPAETKESYLGLVSRLSVLQLRMLRLLSDPAAYWQAVGFTELDWPLTFSGVLHLAFPAIRIEVVREAWLELRDLGIVREGAERFDLRDPLSQELRPVEGWFVGLLTEEGESLVKFCAMPD